MLMCPTSPPVDATQSPALSSEPTTQAVSTSRRFHAAGSRPSAFLLHEQPPPPPISSLDFGDPSSTKKPVVANKPRFKLLQRPKIPRGHKPPLSNVVSPTILQRPCDDNDKDHSQRNSQKQPHEALGRPRDRDPEDLLKVSSRQRSNLACWPSPAGGANASNSDAGGAAGARTPSEESSASSLFVNTTQVDGMSDLRYSAIAAKSRVSSFIALQKQNNTDPPLSAPSFSKTLSVLSTISSTDPEHSRKTQHSENVRSLRERERLYEEAKRRIWTSTQRKGLRNHSAIDRDSGSGPTFFSDGALEASTHRDPSSSSSNRGVWRNEAQNPFIQTEDQQGIATSSMSCLQPSHGYDPFPSERCNFAINGPPQSAGGGLRYQRVEDCEMRRPLSWGGGGKFFGGSPVENTYSYSPNSTGLPMIIGPNNGSHHYQTVPSHRNIGVTRRQDFCEETHRDEELRAGGSAGVGLTEGMITTTSNSIVPQPAYVEPWELVPADPTRAQQKGGTYDGVYTQENGPPPLDNDFLFPPLGRCAENQRPAG